MTAATEVERERGFPWPLLAIVAVAFAVAAYYGLQVTTWKVMTDELLYSKLGVSVFGEWSPRPHIHGEPVDVYNQLYALVTAPVYALFDMPTAFRLVHVVNAAAMASAAVPAYLLARELLLPRLWCYLAAALAVAIPWLTLVTVLFTESVAYPAFLWGVLAMQRCITRPSPAGDALAGAGLLLAFLARTQLLMLAVLLPAAIVLHEVLYRRSLGQGLSRALRDHWVLAACYGAALLAALAVYSPSHIDGVLGAYGTAATGDLLPPGLLRSMAVNLDYIAVGVGVIPVVLGAGWALWSLVRPADREGHAFALLLLLVAGGLVLQATSFELRFGQGFLQERYLFYLAPLFGVAMVRCLIGPERPWPGILAAGAVMVVFLGYAGYAPDRSPLFASPAHGFYPVLDGRSYDIGRLLGRQDLEANTLFQWGTALITVALALALALPRVPRRPLAAGVGLAVLAYGAAATLYVFPKAVDATTAGDFGERVPLEQRDWIDERVPDGASVGLLPSFTGDAAFAAQLLWWDNEFWNRTADRSYTFTGTSSYTPFSSREVTLDEASGRLETDEEAEYLVVAKDFVLMRPAGRRTHSGPPAYPFDLIEAQRPYRAEWVSSGIGEDGWVYEEGARVRFFPGSDGAVARRVHITFVLTPELSPRGYRLKGAERVRSGTVGSGERKTETLTVCVDAGKVTDLLIETDGVSRLPEPDGREVALRVKQIRTEPASIADCG